MEQRHYREVQKHQKTMIQVPIWESSQSAMIVPGITLNSSRFLWSTNMKQPFSSGSFEYRIERMRNRLGPGKVQLSEDGMCGYTVADQPYVDMVAIRKGFVMPDSRDKKIQKEVLSGNLDSQESIHLNDKEMDKLVAWWTEIQNGRDNA